MLRTNKYVHFLYLVIDIILISASFLAVCLLNSSLLPSDPAVQKIYLIVFLFWGICLIFILNNFHLYLTVRYLSILEESFVATKAVGYACTLAALFVFLLKIDIFSRAIFIEATLALLITIVLWRILKRKCIRKLIEAGFLNFNVLIIGVGKESELILQEIEDNPFLGLRVKGVLDDHKTGSFCGLKILGRTENLESIVKRYFIDEIYITAPVDQRHMHDLLERCGKTEKTVRMFVDDYDLFFQKLTLNYLGALPLVTYFQSIPMKANSIIKRLFDVFISILFFILLLPLFLIISLFIKIESPGPIFYVSKRSGKRGVTFNFLKFRSMVYNADNLKEDLITKSEVDGPIFKIKKDPRMTKVGKFLRKYSLDELPQLINVINGDMSLVGPRPFPLEESNKIEYKHIPRLNIRPGITGLAQIKGRSDLKFNNWMRWDAWYVKNWSLVLDIKILLWTIPAVLKGRGAY